MEDPGPMVVIGPLRTDRTVEKLTKSIIRLLNCLGVRSTVISDVTIKKGHARVTVRHSGVEEFLLHAMKQHRHIMSVFDLRQLNIRPQKLVAKRTKRLREKDKSRASKSILSAYEPSPYPFHRCQITSTSTTRSVERQLVNGSEQDMTSQRPVALPRGRGRSSSRSSMLERESAGSIITLRSCSNMAALPPVQEPRDKVDRPRKSQENPKYPNPKDGKPAKISTESKSSTSSEVKSSSGSEVMGIPNSRFSDAPRLKTKSVPSSKFLETLKSFEQGSLKPGLWKRSQSAGIPRPSPPEAQSPPRSQPNVHRTPNLGQTQHSSLPAGIPAHIPSPHHIPPHQPSPRKPKEPAEPREVPTLSEAKRTSRLIPLKEESGSDDETSVRRKRQDKERSTKERVVDDVEDSDSSFDRSSKRAIKARRVKKTTSTRGVTMTRGTDQRHTPSSINRMSRKKVEPNSIGNSYVGWEQGKPAESKGCKRCNETPYCSTGTCQLRKKPGGDCSTGTCPLRNKPGSELSSGIRGKLTSLSPEAKLNRLLETRQLSNEDQYVKSAIRLQLKDSTTTTYSSESFTKDSTVENGSTTSQTDTVSPDSTQSENSETMETSSTYTSHSTGTEDSSLDSTTTDDGRTDTNTSKVKPSADSQFNPYTSGLDKMANSESLHLSTIRNSIQEKNNIYKNGEQIEGDTKDASTSQCEDKSKREFSKKDDSANKTLSLTGNKSASPISSKRENSHGGRDKDTSCGDGKPATSLHDVSIILTCKTSDNKLTPSHVSENRCDVKTLSHKQNKPSIATSSSGSDEATTNSTTQDTCVSRSTKSLLESKNADKIDHSKQSKYKKRSYISESVYDDVASLSELSGLTEDNINSSTVQSVSQLISEKDIQVTSESTIKSVLSENESEETSSALEGKIIYANQEQVSRSGRDEKCLTFRSVSQVKSFENVTSTESIYTVTSCGIESKTLSLLNGGRSKSFGFTKNGSTNSDIDSVQGGTATDINKSSSSIDVQPNDGTSETIKDVSVEKRNFTVARVIEGKVTYYEQGHMIMPSQYGAKENKSENGNNATCAYAEHRHTPNDYGKCVDAIESGSMVDAESFMPSSECKVKLEAYYRDSSVDAIKCGIVVDTSKCGSSVDASKCCSAVDACKCGSMVDSEIYLTRSESVRKVDAQTSTNRVCEVSFCRGRVFYHVGESIHSPELPSEQRHKDGQDDLGFLDEDDALEYGDDIEPGYETGRVFEEKRSVTSKEEDQSGQSEHVIFFNGSSKLPKGKFFRANVGPILCAMLNTEGGAIYYGVSPEGQAIGIKVNYRQEDQLRLDIDDVIKSIYPCVPTDMYNVNVAGMMGDDGYLTPELKVLEIRVNRSQCKARNSQFPKPATYHVSASADNQLETPVLPVESMSEQFQSAMSVLDIRSPGLNSDSRILPSYIFEEKYRTTPALNDPSNLMSNSDTFRSADSLTQVFESSLRISESACHNSESASTPHSHRSNRKNKGKFRKSPSTLHQSNIRFDFRNVVFVIRGGRVQEMETRGRRGVVLVD